MLGTNMINNDNGRIFQDSNFLGSTDLSYLFDFGEKDGGSEESAFYEGNETEICGQMLNTGAGFCEPATRLNIFDSWQRRNDRHAVQKTFNMSSKSTSTIQTQTLQLNDRSTSQYSKHIFQQATASENKKEVLKPEGPPTHLDLCNILPGLQQFSDTKQLSEHSSKNHFEFVLEPDQKSRGLNKMLSTINPPGSPSKHPPATPVKRKSQLEYISEYALKCLTEYGFCAVDNFMGQKEGSQALAEVMAIESQGLFEDGRLVSQEQDCQSVRGDKIFWINSDRYPAISRLISRMDRIVFKLQKSFPGKSVSSRTKPMVACYPGIGAAYRRHVDNSNSDGRLITCLYYLNKDWDILRDGGILRLYPSSMANKVEIEPIFDRILFFWSDGRNPHEVLPAFRNRYAITVWYFDQKEREKAMKRHNLERE